MTIECYYSQCPKHGANETPPDEGPFCFERECSATVEEIKFYALSRKIERMGYDLEELDKDNPYTQFGDNL